MIRHAILVTSRLARAQCQLDAAREAAHGRQIMAPDQLAARLAGGFLQAVERDALLDALHESLGDKGLELAELGPIRDLPGMARAAAGTLTRAWVAGLDLSERAAGAAGDGRARLADLAALEADVLRRLPRSMLRPIDLVRRARERQAVAPRVIGPVAVRSVPDLDPVWRPFLVGLAEVVPVTWHLGQFEAPAWLEETSIEISSAPDRGPAIARVSCANPRHEALEALRWARDLVASGAARPEDIAIAAPATAEWDEHIAAIADDANLPVAFLHGRPVLSTWAGQTAAALADVLLAGLGQARVRRLFALARGGTPAMRALPDDWHRILEPDAPLLHRSQWEQAIAQTTEWPGGTDFGDALRRVIALIAPGHTAAHESGDALLDGRARAIWRKALKEGPASALDVTLTGIRVDEPLDPCTSMVWCPAADVAACPRGFVRLLGLTSRGWPRTQGEDPLLPAHVVAPLELDPVPVPERDRRDFRTALRAARCQVVLSRSRRDAGGRQAGESALPRQEGIEAERYLRRERIPEHAVSEADRLLARPAEFAATARAQAAVACWQNWHLRALTAHDGMVRANHPVIERVLRGLFSATRLRKLARDPLGFVWRYALGWSAPEEGEEPLSLDPLAFGNLVHRVLELAIDDLGGARHAFRADAIRVGQTLALALDTAREEFESASAVPPRLMWLRTLAEAQAMAHTALLWDEPRLGGQRSYAEVPFGTTEVTGESDGPWDATLEVTIPGTDMAIGGRIDRLDVSDDGARVRVTDFKTGRLPRGAPELDGGGELQRCLYASAVRSLLGAGVVVDARLHYLRDAGGMLALEDADEVLARVTHYLVEAREHVRAGRALVGPDSGLRADDPLTFALPGNAKDVYLEIKRVLAGEQLEPLPDLWELP